MCTKGSLRQFRWALSPPGLLFFVQMIFRGLNIFDVFNLFTLQEDCEANLAVAMPALDAAVRALDTLKQQDITIVKTMTNPPAGVRLVMEAICIMKVLKMMMMMMVLVMMMLVMVMVMVMLVMLLLLMMMMRIMMRIMMMVMVMMMMVMMIMMMVMMIMMMVMMMAIHNNDDNDDDGDNDGDDGDGVGDVYLPPPPPPDLWQWLILMLLIIALIIKENVMSAINWNLMMIMMIFFLCRASKETGKSTTKESHLMTIGQLQKGYVIQNDSDSSFLCRLNECSWRHIAIQILYVRASVRPLKFRLTFFKLLLIYYQYIHPPIYYMLFP